MLKSNDQRDSFLRATTSSGGPLHDPTYLKSPIDSIIGSLPNHSHISAHDLMDAYNTFTNRVRALGEQPLDGRCSIPALQYLELRTVSLTQALRRDIQLAHVDPFSFESHQHTFPQADSLTSTQDITPDAIQRARDMSSLCLYALCALSVIVRFPVLYAMFSSASDNLNALLDDVLNITHAQRLPVHNSRKTYSLSLWVIQFQRLPLATLSLRSLIIVGALGRTLEREPAQNDVGAVAIDGLKGIRHLVTNHASVFLAPISDLLPLILPTLTSSSPSLRLQAACVLGAVVSALTSPSFSNTSLECRSSISGHVLAFIDAQCSRPTPTQPSTGLPSVVQAALTMEKQSCLGEGPSWALCVLASLVVLSNYTLFSHPRALKFIFRSLALSLTHNRSIVRALHPCIWRCLIWAFGRLGEQTNDLDDASVRDSAFLVIKQELNASLGIVLVATLIGPAECSASPASECHAARDNVSKALTVLDDMVRGSNAHTAQEGLFLLAKLTNGVGASSPPSNDIPAWNPDQALPSALFDGTMLNAEWSHLQAALRTIPSPSVREVRQLSEAEIVQHHDMLSSIWVHIAHSHSERLLSGELVHVWQSLLLAQAQLTQGHGHLTTPSESATRAGMTVIGFLSCLSIGPIVEPWQEIADQMRRLSIVKQLWAVMKNVFAPPCLARLAELILGAIVRQQFLISNEDVRDVWSKLCADLISVGNPSFLKGLFQSVGLQRGPQVQVQRELWGVAARSTVLLGSKPKWQDVVTFLSTPVGIWTMSDSEMELWEALLQFAISDAQRAFVESSAVIESFASQVKERHLDASLATQKPLIVLLAHLDLREGMAFPISLLAFVDRSLRVNYHHKPELLEISLDLLRALRALITSSPVSLVVRIIPALQQGLCLWVEDRAETLLEDEYNDVIMPLYCDSLKVLESHALSPVTLASLSTFLAAGFVRIPRPALGPIAFEKFWRATYYRQTHFYDDIPANVRACLRAFQDAYGGDLSIGVTHFTDSQTTSSTTGSHPPSQNAEVLQDTSSRTPGMADRTATQRAGRRSTTIQEVIDVSRATTPTPIARTISPVQIPALRHLQDCASHAEESLPIFVAPTPPGSSPSNIPRPCCLSPHSPLVDVAPVNRVRTRGSTKRKSDDFDDKLVKRSRTLSRMPPRRSRRIISEPANRVTSPVIISRPGSAPAGRCRRLVFDGIELPTLRQVLARDRQGSRTASAQPKSIKEARVPSLQQISGPPLTRSPSVSSEEYDSWELGCLEADASEMEVDDSLVAAPFSSPLQTQSPVADTDHSTGSIMIPVGPASRPTRAQSQGSPSVPHRLPLRRSRTTSARLDALHDVYAAVSNGASQIPVQELLQATKLVHQIGTVLSEQIGKKFGGAR
ncbi:hypothetical protein BV22DRAFT_1075479 [Leucogyrophana mollusca]|uniref:Uncharacterized protein n=1 Tax=Leucogyrophana mollusca TaxID=85980 RepID=A0ACB8B2A3_9AGAM|nr:hypothetical protein BV22DRAFT_1075479 [Leucogyrophana mollusca]